MVKSLETGKSFSWLKTMEGKWYKLKLEMKAGTDLRGPLDNIFLCILFAWMRLKGATVFVPLNYIWMIYSLSSDCWS